jgi:aminoglycoside phosphotransferase (APT) family kinase protein
MRAIGASLAMVHRDLVLPEGMKMPLPQEYRMACSEAFLHCDFGLANVRLTPGNGRPVIIDWQVSPRLGTQATYGTRFFDLMWFVYDLFYRPVGRSRYKMAVGAAPMAREFLSGYFSACDSGCDMTGFKEYTQRFIDAKSAARKEGHHWKRQLQLIPSHIRLRRFINLDDPSDWK